MISTDLKMFKMVQKFLNSNKTLEEFDVSYCNIDEKAGELIGKGLRGNRNLQVFILKGNPIGAAVREIAKSFIENKKALCIKELDLSKCSIECQHITSEFIEMIKSPFTTIKTLSLRDNFLKNRSGILIQDALKENVTITKIHVDYNPLKAQCVK
jgi:Ran GTPase-activating protein (RanGAP) involved in mRNA processing and transport